MNLDKRMPAEQAIEIARAEEWRGNPRVLVGRLGNAARRLADEIEQRQSHGSVYCPHPLRVQRKRTKGWRMPEHTVYVGRPSRWGNPFQSAVPSPVPDSLGCQTVFGMKSPALVTEMAVLLFRHWLLHWRARWPGHWEAYIAPLREKQLACWCALDKPCHADVLAEAASGGDLLRRPRRADPA